MISKGARVPRLVEGVDLTALPLTPLEGFVLSRIDGAASVQVLADLTNLDEDHVYRMAERLIELGAAEWSRESVSLPLPTGRPSTKTPSREIEVPPFLRGPPSRPVPGPARVRMRAEPRPASVRPPARLDGVYSSQPPVADEVDMAHSSVFPSSPRRVRSTAPPDAKEPFELPLPPPPPDIELPPPPSPERLARLSESNRPVVETPPTEPGAGAVVLPPPPSEPPPSQPEPSTRRAPIAAPYVETPSEPALDPPSELIFDAPLEATADTPASAEVGDSKQSEPAAAPLEAADTSAAPSSHPPAASVIEPVDAEPEAPSSEPAAPKSEPAVAEAEELDLPGERQMRIDNLYFALELLDHYQVLGVGRDAPRPEIRNAYFQLSKVFHPDTMFRKRLGAYKARMEAIFQRLTEAYETLGKKKLRAEYDHYLSLQDKTRQVERTLDVQDESDERERLGRAAAQYEADIAAGRPPSTAETEIPEQLRSPDPATSSSLPPEATSSVPPGSTSSKPPARRQMSETGKRQQRELMAQKLRNATRQSGSVRRSNPAATPPPSAPKVDRKEVLRGLTSSLQQSSLQTGGLDRVKRHIARAKRAEAEGDITEAVNHLRAALLSAPDREDLKAEHARVGAELAKTMATTYEEQAVYEERHGKWAAAAISWGKVLTGRPKDAHAARRTAIALVEAGGDMHKAKQLAQLAADLDPDNVENLRGLARVYIAAGLELNARRVLQHAAKLDPDDEMVENLLRDLGR